MAVVHGPGLLAARRLVRLALLASALPAACGGDQDRGREVAATETAEAPAPRPAEADPDTIPPPVPDGEPMPPAETAAGIPPYPGAIVWMPERAPSSTYRVNAFTPDTWERVAAFYQDGLPGWRMIRTRDVIVFQKEPDQAAITISPWDFGALAPDAPEPLRKARTAIGAAWR